MTELVKLSECEIASVKIYKQLVEDTMKEMAVESNTIFAGARAQSTLEMLEDWLTDASQNLLDSFFEDQNQVFMINCLQNAQKQFENTMLKYNLKRLHK